MAKPASIKSRLNSTADTGFFYVTKKNAAEIEPLIPGLQPLLERLRAFS